MYTQLVVVSQKYSISRQTELDWRSLRTAFKHTSKYNPSCWISLNLNLNLRWISDFKNSEIPSTIYLALKSTTLEKWQPVV